MRKKLFYEFIGAKIKQKREEKGLTIDELSLKTGIRKIYLQKIEEGKASRFSTFYDSWGIGNTCQYAGDRLGRVFKFFNPIVTLRGWPVAPM